MNTANISTNDSFGVPCLRNTKFPIHQLLLEISAARGGMEEVAENLNLDIDSIRGALEDIAEYFFLKCDWLEKTEE